MAIPAIGVAAIVGPGAGIFTAFAVVAWRYRINRTYSILLAAVFLALAAMFVVVDRLQMANAMASDAFGFFVIAGLATFFRPGLCDGTDAKTTAVHSDRSE